MAGACPRDRKPVGGFPHRRRPVARAARREPCRAAGEIVGIVGESGCGKSTLINAVIGLLAANAEIASGRILFKGADLLRMGADDLRRLRGDRITADLPGPDDGAESGALDRHADDRDPVPLRARPRAPSGGAPSNFWRKCASPIRSGGSANIRTSSPAACGSASASPWRSSPSPTS